MHTNPSHTTITYTIWHEHLFIQKNIPQAHKDQLRDALNDQGHIGIIYRGLTKFIMAKKGSASNLINKTIHLQIPTIRTITLLEENGVQI
jgi:hypothetical protein